MDTIERSPSDSMSVDPITITNDQANKPSKDKEVSAVIYIKSQINNGNQVASHLDGLK